jgi:hypothetical protein
MDKKRRIINAKIKEEKITKWMNQRIK